MVKKQESPAVVSQKEKSPPLKARQTPLASVRGEKKSAKERNEEAVIPAAVPSRKAKSSAVGRAAKTRGGSLRGKDSALVDQETSLFQAVASPVPLVTLQSEEPVEQKASGEGAVQEEAQKNVLFDTFGLAPEVRRVIAEAGYVHATPVQQFCLPVTLKGRDVAGFAQTGTGKTAVFLLTFIQRMVEGSLRSGQSKKPSGLVLVPTRELAAQIASDATLLYKTLGTRTLAVFGGVDVEKQARVLAEGIDLLIATPGRLIDLSNQNMVDFSEVGFFVCDECDRMFDMGFIDDVERILRKLSSEHVQKLLFSATGSEKVKELAFKHLENPEYVETNPEKITPENITQVAFAVPAHEKFQVLLGHLREYNPTCAVVFTNTKIAAEWVSYKLSANGFQAETFTGDVPQAKRFAIVDKIKTGQLKVLVATDVASRGIHVANLSHVYNFDVPEEPENFIHRIGRTARAGESGTAVTLVCEDYGFGMGAIQDLLGFSVQMTAVPKSYYDEKDVSDYPFDANGRVKVFGRQADVQPEAVSLPEEDVVLPVRPVVESEKAVVTATAPVPVPVLSAAQRPAAASSRDKDVVVASHDGGDGDQQHQRRHHHQVGRHQNQPRHAHQHQQSSEGGASSSHTPSRQDDRRPPVVAPGNQQAAQQRQPLGSVSAVAAAPMPQISDASHHSGTAHSRSHFSGGRGGHNQNATRSVGGGSSGFPQQQSHTGGTSQSSSYKRPVDDRARDVIEAARAAARVLAEKKKGEALTLERKSPVTLVQTKENILNVLRGGLDGVLEALQKQIEDWRQRLSPHDR